MRVILTEEGVKVAHYKAAAGDVIDIPEDEARVHLLLKTAVEAPPPRPPRSTYVPTGRPRGRPRREESEGEAEQHVVAAEGDVQASAEHHVPEPGDDLLIRPGEEVPATTETPTEPAQESETTRFYRRRDIRAED